MLLFEQMLLGGKKGLVNTISAGPWTLSAPQYTSYESESIVALSSTLALIQTFGGGWPPRCSALTISGTSISVGGFSQLNYSQSNLGFIRKIDSTSALALCRTNTGSSPQYWDLAKITVSGGSASYGSSLRLVSNAIYGAAVEVLSANYALASHGSSIWLIDISGATPAALGSAATAPFAVSQITMLDANRALLIGGNSACIVSVSGGTITGFGPVVDLGSYNGGSWSADKLDDSRLIAAQYGGYCRVLTVSGTTIQAGPVATLEGGSPDYGWYWTRHVCALSADTAIVFYSTQNGSNNAKANALNIDGDAVTVGTKQEVISNPLSAIDRARGITALSPSAVIALAEASSGPTYTSVFTI